MPDGWRDDALAVKWHKIRQVRRVVTGALEIERSEKRIGSSLQAAPVVFVAEEYAASLEGVDLAEICITSGATLTLGDTTGEAFSLDEVPGVSVVLVMPRERSANGAGRCCLKSGATAIIRIFVTDVLKRSPTLPLPRNETYTLIPLGAVDLGAGGPSGSGE